MTLDEFVRTYFSYQGFHDGLDEFSGKTLHGTPYAMEMPWCFDEKDEWSEPGCRIFIAEKERVVFTFMPEEVRSYMVLTQARTGEAFEKQIAVLAEFYLDHYGEGARFHAVHRGAASQVLESAGSAGGIDLPDGL